MSPRGVEALETVRAELTVERHEEREEAVRRAAWAAADDGRSDPPDLDT